MKKLFVYSLFLISIVISLTGCGGDSGDVVTSTNTAPIADAGIDRNIITGVLATLDGSGSSDADNDPLSYLWSFDSVPVGSTAVLFSETMVNPFFIPDVHGGYTVSLVVNDGTVDSVEDTVTFTASLTANNPPTADAGTDRSVVTGVVAILDGSGSSDVDGDTLSYQWSFDSVPVGSTAVLFSETTVNPSFIPNVDGGYTVSLVVNDGTNDSAADTVTLTASTAPVNNAPTADAGVDRTVDAGDIVVLDGSGSSDIDGDTLFYQWSFDEVPAGSTTALSSETIVNPTFSPDIEGVYKISLTVNDGMVDSAPDRVAVTAAASGSYTAGLVKYDADCASCHAAGTYDPVEEKASDLYGDGDLLINDLYTISGMSKVANITAQEVLDLKAFLDDPSIE